MMRSPVLLCALLLAACQQAPDTGASGDDAGAPAASAPQVADGASASSAAAAPAAGAEQAPASAAPAASADAPPASDSSGAAASAAADAGGTATPPADGADPVAGTDYDVVQGGQPYEPLDGKIEVVEVFNYICPACDRFEPLFSAWKAKAPADVRVTYVPAPFNPQWVPYTRAYYAAQLRGLVDKTHKAMFDAIHVEHSLPGEGQKPDEQAIAAFYGKFGADPKQFLADMHSFAVEVDIGRSKQFMIREGVSSTPTIIVDGKYRVTTGRTYQDVLRVTDALIAMERAAQAGAAQ